MGANLELEVDIGDVLQILSTNGIRCGKAVAALSMLFPNYKELYDPETWEYAWFKKLDELTQYDPGLISRITYSGNWEYGEHEYERFRRREAMFSNLTKEEFLHSIGAVANMWTPIETVIETVRELIRVLPKMGKTTDWFSPQDTLEGFGGLLNTLLLARQRGGKAVRFRGS